MLYPESIAVGDVDGGGDGDIVLGESAARLLRNDGTSFTDVSATNIPPGLGLLRRPILADVDNDGDLDIYYAKPGQDRLLRNNGAGVFTDVTATSLPVEGSPHTPVAAADVDGDGLVDLISNGLDRGRILRNTGGGVFVDESSLRLPAPPTFTNLIATVDVDRDGDVDLVQRGFGPLPDRFLINKRGGHLQRPVSRPAGHGRRRRAGRDVRPAARRRRGSARAHARRAAARVAARSDELGGGPGPAALAPPRGLQDLNGADVDGDGDVDAIVSIDGSSATPLRTLLLRNIAGDRLVDESNAPWTVLEPVVDWFDADLDGDGDVVTRGSSTTLELAFNDGDRRWRSGGTLAAAAPGLGLPSILHGDLDGDGDPDVLLSTGGCLANDGFGGFSPVAPLTFQPSSAIVNRAFALGDVDHDGDLDVVSNEGFTQPADHLYLNDGSGRFTDVSATWGLGSGIGSGGIVLADVDGDGDLDVLSKSWLHALALPVPLRILRNDGGSFTDLGTAVPAITGTFDQHLVDVDGDGDLDLVAITAGLRVFENRANTFVDVTTARVPVQPADTMPLLVADVDGDGAPDLLAGRDPMRVLRNTGGVFVLDTSAGPVDSPVGLADVDGDGDPDLLDGTGVLTNLHRQLVPTPSPLPGQAWPLTVLLQPGHAPQPGVALVSASLARMRPTLPLPFGVWELQSPVTLGLVLVPPVVGTGVLAPQVPANPALRGLELFLQGVALQGPGLTRLGLLPFAAGTIE